MGTEIRDTLRPAVVLLTLFTLLTGIAYPLAITGIAQVALPYQANGSLVRDGSTVLGSALIGQGVARDDLFHGRPSAAGKGYDATASSGSNLAPGAPDLDKRIKGDVATLRGQGVTGGVPVDLVTTSASGLDPDISPEAALLQAPRVARARGLPVDVVTALARAQQVGAFAQHLDGLAHPRRRAEQDLEPPPRLGARGLQQRVGGRAGVDHAGGLAGPAGACRCVAISSRRLSASTLTCGAPIRPSGE